MKSADTIVFMLIIGYIVFTTNKGNLKKWIDVFGISTGQQSGSYMSSYLRGLGR